MRTLAAAAIVTIAVAVLLPLEAQAASLEAVCIQTRGSDAQGEFVVTDTRMVADADRYLREHQGSFLRVAGHDCGSLSGGTKRYDQPGTALLIPEGNTGVCLVLDPHAPRILFSGNGVPLVVNCMGLIPGPA